MSERQTTTPAAVIPAGQGYLKLIYCEARESPGYVIAVPLVAWEIKDGGAHPIAPFPQQDED